MMRFILQSFAVTLLLALLACGPESNSVRDSARESLGVSDNSTPVPPNTSTATPLPVAPGANVQHYICPNNCEGSGGPAAGTCPVCGTEYVHNQAFHAQQQQPAGTTTTTPSGTEKVRFDGITAPADGSTPPPPTPEPAQNAAGVWHYTCANGCEGGAGSAGTCAKCGGALSHNAAYHQ